MILHILVFKPYLMVIHASGARRYRRRVVVRVDFRVFPLPHAARGLRLMLYDATAATEGVEVPLLQAIFIRVETDPPLGGASTSSSLEAEVRV